MKNCIHCGKPIPDDASFCPYCETVQGEVKQEAAPKRIRKSTVVLVCILLAAAILLIRHAAAPKVIDAKGPELTYGDYRLVLTFTRPDTEEMIPEPQENGGASLTVVDDGANPSMLFIAGKESETNLREEFEEQIESIELSAAPRDGAEPMRWSEPEYSPRVPGAMRMADLHFDTACGSNDIYWTLHMKNGDILKLQHNFTCVEEPSIVYRPEDVPMDTIEDLQALLDRIDKEIPPTVPVYIFLPGVTYEGGLTLANRTCALFGRGNFDDRPIFTGTITVSSSAPEKQRIQAIRFEGEDAGIAAYASAMASECTFTNVRTGIAVYDGAAFDPHSCVFEGCGTGILYDVNGSPYHVALELDHCEFRSSHTGLHVKAFANGEAVICHDCTFSGNETDIQNDTDVLVDTSGAVFE